MTFTQEEINQNIVEAQQKRDRGEALSEYEWTLLAYAFPPACHVCSAHHVGGHDDSSENKQLFVDPDDESGQVRFG